jgi:hypothetical protein
LSLAAELLKNGRPLCALASSRDVPIRFHCEREIVGFVSVLQEIVVTQMTKMHGMSLEGSFSVCNATPGRDGREAGSDSEFGGCQIGALWPDWAYSFRGTEPLSRRYCRGGGRAPEKLILLVVSTY